MKIKVYDKLRKKYVPTDDFVITSSGKVLFAYDQAIPNDGDSVDPFKSPIEYRFMGYKENEKVKQKDLEVKILVGKTVSNLTKLNLKSNKIERICRESQ